MSAQLTSTDEDVVRRFASAVGVGRVSGPYQYTGNRKPYWRWQASGFERTQAVIAMLWPGLGARRRARAVEVLASLGDVRGRIRTAEEASRVARCRWAA